MTTYVLKAELKMDASEIVKERKCRVLCWMFQLIEPGLPRREFDVTSTMPLITAVFKIIAMSYLAIRVENAIKFELQS